MATLLELLFKVNHSDLEKAEESVDHLKDKVKELANEIPGLNSVLGQLGGAASEVGDVLVGLEAGLASAVVAASAAVVAFGAVGVALAFKYNEKVDELNDLAEAFGYSASQVDLMKMAAEGAGSSFQAVEQVFTKAAAAAYKAKDPLAGTGAAFKQLGIDIHDANGELKSSSDLVAETLEKWKDGEKTTADFAAAQQILGKSFQEQIPAIEDSIDAMKRANEFREQGIGISEKAIEVSKAHKQATQDLTFILDAMGSQLSAQVIPYFTDLVKSFVSSYQEGGRVKDVFVAMQYATEGLLVIFDVLVKVASHVAESFRLLGEIMGGASAMIFQILEGNYEGAAEIFKGLKESWARDVDAAQKNALEVFHRGAKLFNGEFQKQRDEIAKVGEEGKGNHSHGGGTPSKRPTVATEEDPNKAIKSLIDSLQQQVAVQQHLNTVEQISIRLTNEKYKSASETYKQQVRELALKKDLAEQDNILNDGTRKLLDTADKFSRNIEKEITRKEKSRYELMAENQQLALQRDYLETIQKLREKGLLTTEAAIAATQRYNEGIDDSVKAIDALKKSDEDWVKNGANSYIDSIGSMTDAMSGLVDKGLKGFEGMIDQLLMTGKFSFKEFALSIVSDIMKMIVQFTIMIPLARTLKEIMGSSSSSGSGSGWAAAASAIGSAVGYAFADGGDPAVGTTNIVGEKGPELFIPKTPGTIVPIKPMAQSGQSTQINNNISVSIGSVDSKERQDLLIQEIRKMITIQTKQTLADQMRTGNMLRPVR